MTRTGTHFTATALGDIEALGRVTLHECLALTGSEISINELPAGASIPFVHAHKENEEVYIILRGKGQFYLDGETFDIQEGWAIRVDPAGQRCLKAGREDSLRYLCIQTTAKSLLKYTRDDGFAVEAKPSWL